MGHRQPAENWIRAYSEEPGIFDAFSRAEDPRGLLARLLLERAGLAGRDVLEVGCGSGRYSRELAPHAASWVGLERSAPLLALAGDGRRPGPVFVCGDARRLPFAAASFDRVVAGWVLAYMRPDSRRATLAEMGRVLRPGGEVWIVENESTGEFQALRGRNAEPERARQQVLIEAHGFTRVEVVHTELCFPSTDEALRVLGYLCGDAVRERLEKAPVAALAHDVVILRRRAPLPEAD